MLGSENIHELGWLQNTKPHGPTRTIKTIEKPILQRTQVPRFCSGNSNQDSFCVFALTRWGWMWFWRMSGYFTLITWAAGICFSPAMCFLATWWLLVVCTVHNIIVVPFTCISFLRIHAMYSYDESLFRERWLGPPGATWINWTKTTCSGVDMFAS